MVFWQKVDFLAYMEANSPLKTKFNLNIDDLSPAISELDSFWCLNKMFAKNKGMKADAFIIPNWAGSWDIRNHSWWIQGVKNLLKLHNLNLCLHGYEHDLRDRRVSEFSGKNTNECVKILQASMDILDKVGLPYEKSFRPPRWHVTDYLLEACAELDINMVYVAWSTSPFKLWRLGLDTVYNNLYHSNSRFFPSESHIGDDRHKIWAAFTNQVICHAHFGSNAYDTLRSRRITFPISDLIPENAEYIYLCEAVSFRKVMENADSTIQALC